MKHEKKSKTTSHLVTSQFSNKNFKGNNSYSSTAPSKQGAASRRTVHARMVAPGAHIMVLRLTPLRSRHVHTSSRPVNSSSMGEQVFPSKLEARSLN